MKAEGCWQELWKMLGIAPKIDPFDMRRWLKSTSLSNNPGLTELLWGFSTHSDVYCCSQGILPILALMCFAPKESLQSGVAEYTPLFSGVLPGLLQ